MSSRNTIDSGKNLEENPIINNNATEIGVVSDNVKYEVDSNFGENVDEFIGRYTMTGTNDQLNISEDTKQFMKLAENSAQGITKSSKSMKELSERLEHYSQGMKYLLEETLEGSKENGFNKHLKKGLHKAKSMKYLGYFVGKLTTELSNFDRNTMDELEQGGLTDLSHKSESAINSVKGQYQSLLKSKEVFEEAMIAKKEDLKKVADFLAKNVQNDSCRETLIDIQDDLSNYIIILETQLHNTNNGLELYKLSITELIKDIPKNLTYLATSLTSYKLAEAGKIGADTSHNMRELSQSSMVLPFEVVNQVGEQLLENYSTPLVSDQSIQQVLGLIGKIENTTTKLEENLNKRKSGNTNNLLLALKEKNSNYKKIENK